MPLVPSSFLHFFAENIEKMLRQPELFQRCERQVMTVRDWGLRVVDWGVLNDVDVCASDLLLFHAQNESLWSVVRA